MVGRKEVPALIGLRFVAAFWVFLFHVHIRWPLTENAFFFLTSGARRHRNEPFFYTLRVYSCLSIH